MQHAEGCEPSKGCVQECDVDSFLRVLEAPLLDFEIEAEERASLRLAEFMRGEINVA